MAQRVEVTLIDDIDGKEAAETVSFSLDGVSYEIDLSDKHAAQIRNDLAKWTGHARRSGAGGRPSARRRSGGAGGSGRVDMTEVRDWARANGHQVSDRGRISTAVQTAYDEAH
ncbi:MAG: hypothetical protein JWP82_698 [Humibacillus sp.]|nr:hypothetical protein [Humibacillus sp.]